MTSQWAGKYNGEPINAFYHSALLEGATSEYAGNNNMGAWNRLDLPDHEDPDNIDAWHRESVEDANDMLSASEVTMLCSQTIGVIVREDTEGFVSVDCYSDLADFVSAWQTIVEMTTLNECDQCNVAAMEYGADSAITHAPGCSSRFDFLP